MRISVVGKSKVGVNPPKSPLKKGTKIRILAPCLVRFLARGTRAERIRFLRGFGGFRSRNEV
jgi:hypothetical protein